MKEKMIVISPINLKIPIHARVGKINPDYQSNMIIYFSGRRFEWVRTILTPVLASDLSRALDTQNIKDWFGREIELYSDNNDIRARVP